MSPKSYPWDKIIAGIILVVFISALPYVISLYFLPRLDKFIPVYALFAYEKEIISSYYLDVWYALIWTFFMLSILASASCVIMTYRSPGRSRGKWKNFWNLIEILWLMAAAATVWSLVMSSSQLAKQMLYRDNTYYNHIHANSDASLRSLVDNFLIRHCEGDHQSEDCNLVRDVIAKIDHGATEEDAGKIFLLLSAAIESNESVEKNKMLAEMQIMADRLLWAQAAYTEWDVRLPLWAKWLSILAPHLFSVMFPLRLGRACAAFAF